MSRQLPERPNLQQLKKQAKTLLDVVQARKPEALERFEVLPTFSKTSVSELGSLTFALHHGQSVIAREYGFASWNALRKEVEARSLSFGAAVDEFVRCATGGALHSAKRLLALRPDIASATLQTSLVLGDAGAVEAWLRERPESAKTSIGPQNLAAASVVGDKHEEVQ